MLFSLYALKAPNSTEKTKLRITSATLNGNPSTKNDSCYSPTDASKESDITTFYDVLSSLVRHIPKHDILIVGGDMNPQIGKDENNKFCLHNLHK